VILLDTGGLLSNYDRSDRYHAQVSPILARPQSRLLSPFVLAELDYLLSKLAGQVVEQLMLDDVSRGAYRLEHFSAADVAAAAAVIDRYKGLNLGLADASIVVLAERYGCNDLLTLDQRHFRAIIAGGRPFRLLPFDVR
jgi:uncharacterized protein